MDDTPTFGAWLRRRRRALDLTQDALAQLVGCSVVSIRKFEGDEQRPSRAMAERLASQLQIAPDQQPSFIQYARMGLDHAPPELPLPRAAELPRSGQSASALPLMPAPAPPAPQPSQPALVGRRAEWQTMRSAWSTARLGCAQLVVITGEAGIGKTRLAEELISQADQDGALTAHAHTYAAAGQLAYAPLIAWLRTPVLHRRAVQVSDSDLSELARLMPELLNERPEIEAPRPVTETWQRLRLFEALAHAMLADRQPLLLVLNDLQWCDQETLDWLHYLLRQAPQAPLLIVATVRIEDPRAEALRAWWLNLEREGQVTEIELHALDADETQTLAQQLSAGALASERTAQLYRQTEGNPLFVVELVRLELSAGAGAPPAETGGSLQPARAALPNRMQAVLQTRLGQLTPAARDLAQLAATIGRAFGVAVLTHASEAGEGAVVAALDELWQRRIVREQADGSYDFSHDKLRGVAATALSPARRRLLHRRVAEALEQLHADALDETSAQIAMHYQQAGLPERAIPYFRQSAAAAHQVGALQEAAHQLQQGLGLFKLLPSSPERLQQELELQVELAATLVLLRGFAGAEVEQAYDRALELCQQAERTAELFPILWGLHEVYLFQARGTQSRKIAEQLMETAQHLRDPALLLQGHHAMWGVLYHLFSSELSLAIAHAEEGLIRYDVRIHRDHILHYGGHDAGICCRQVLTRAYWLLGYPERARQYIEETLALADQIDHPFSQSMALNNMATVHLYLRDAVTVDHLATCGITVATKHRIPLLIAEGRILQGWARSILGEPDRWIDQMLQSMAEWNALGSLLQQAYHRQLLAEVYLKANRSEEALSAINAALTVTHASGEDNLEAEAHRLHGEALLATGAPAAQAEEAYQQALAVARRQGARSLELRASVSLARLWHSQGRRAEAHQLLAAIYGWFTEGFDTADLIEAQALLDELEMRWVGR